MSRTSRLIWALILLAFLAAPFASPDPAEAATLTVNATDDTSDGTCNATHCSLREAVYAANLTSGPDTISFNIPGTGPHVIRLTSGLSITSPSTVLAGDTQPGYAGQPVIVVDGSLTAGRGLTVVGDYSVVRGLSLVRFTDSTAILVGAHHASVERCYLGVDAAGAAAGNSVGIMLSGNDQVLVDSTIAANQVGVLLVTARRTVVQRNRIGVNPAGDVLGNGTGIRLEGATEDVLIGGDSRDQKNVIVGSALYGIQDASTPMGGNVIDNNFIGTTGLEAAPNGVGVYRFPDAGSAAGALTVRRNVIAGNGTGVWLNGDRHAVEDNFIGIDYLFHAMPNTEAGVRLEGCVRCVVDGNVISGNPVGVLLTDGIGGEFDSVISHNRIGVDPGISYVIPNGIGIQIDGGERTVIEGNSIGGNDYGLQLNGGDATVRGNRIGHMGFGPALPNMVGIRTGIGFAASNIGGSTEADGNIIAHNAGDGIRSLAAGQVIWNNQIHHNGGHGVHIDAGMAEPAAGLGTIISVNSIYDNDGLGIAIENPGLVGGLEPPVISRASTTEVSGTAEPGSLVEVFLAAVDPSGAGEGMTYLAYNRAASDGSFTVRFTGAGSCPTFTATATHDGGTSEFSRNRSTCARIPPPVAAVLILLGAAGGSAFTLVIRRRPPDLRSVPGILLGALIGLGLGLLFLSLPFVQINWEGNVRNPTPIPIAGNLPAPVTLTPVPITLTPAPDPEIMALEDANCRQGPSTQFNVATHLQQGQVVPVTGRLSEGGWWQVQAPALDLPCWVAESVAEANGDLSAVPVIIPPAPPTPTPIREPEQGCYCNNTQQCLYTVPCPANCIPCP